MIRELSESFCKQPIIRRLDLDIRTGEFLDILGPSGCGKSTVLRLIAGLEDINSGEIHIDGLLVNNKEPRDRGCAMVFQNYALHTHMTVADNIGYVLRVAGLPRQQRIQPVEEVAAILGLSNYLERKPGELSGGQRQRVAMGRAIIRKPRVFLFDKPLSNLNDKLRIQMRLEIRKLHARLGVTSSFVTHEQVEAMTMADRLLVMKDGNIEQAGTPDQIYSQPDSIYVAGFVGSPPMNLLTVLAIDNPDSSEFAFAILDDNQPLPLTGNILPVNQTTHLTAGFRAEKASILNQDGAQISELPNNGYQIVNADKK